MSLPVYTASIFLIGFILGTLFAAYIIQKEEEREEKNMHSDE